MSAASMNAMAEALDVDDALLERWPLPQPDTEGDKEQRGRALVVAGRRELPGAARLAGEAALRSGCGKLLLATPASLALPLGLAIPEARVLALPERDDDGVGEEAVEPLQPWAARVASALLGPGWVDGDACAGFVRRLLPLLGQVPVVLDAAAMAVVPSLPRAEAPRIVTPHAGEMARLTGEAKEAIAAHPARAAREAASRWNVVVVLKGALTMVATPAGELWRHDGRGRVGLATSGSGDVLSGLIAGLAARGAPPAQAAVWGVALHARAGAALERRAGALGYLARELAGEVPRLMAR